MANYDFYIEIAPILEFALLKCFRLILVINSKKTDLVAPETH